MTGIVSRCVWFLMTLICSIALYQTSNRVRALDVDLHRQETAIATEQQSLHLLKAEWVYLNSPTRVADAARKHLALRPTQAQQLAGLKDMNTVLPGQDEQTAPQARTVAEVTTPPSQRRVAVATAEPVSFKSREVIQHHETANAHGDSLGQFIMALDHTP